MTTTDDRIAQFQQMAGADPDNEMAHFSLGSAYLDAGRFEEAAESLQRCVAIDASLSKAWELCGKAMLGSGQNDQAQQILTRGYETAATRGDRLPMESMGEMLKSIGVDPPEVKEAPPSTPPPDGSFVCAKTGQPGTPLDDPPMRGPVGQWIAANICQESWTEWIGQGTKVINEMRLDFSRVEDQETYDRFMAQYLGIPEDLLTS